MYYVFISVFNFGFFSSKIQLRRIWHPATNICASCFQDDINYFISKATCLWLRGRASINTTWQALLRICLSFLFRSSVRVSSSQLSGDILILSTVTVLNSSGTKYGIYLTWLETYCTTWF